MSNEPGVKQSRGVDEGICLPYYRLSYRRKFIRTLWVFPFSLGILFVNLPYREVWFAVSIVLGILQAVYNYWKWKSEEKS